MHCHKLPAELIGHRVTAAAAAAAAAAAVAAAAPFTHLPGFPSIRSNAICIAVPSFRFLFGAVPPFVSLLKRLLLLRRNLAFVEVFIRHFFYHIDRQKAQFGAIQFGL